MLRHVSIAVALALGAGSALAQTPAPQKPAGQTPPASTQAKPDEKKPAQKPGQPKPYKDVITAEAKSDPGLFTVHRIDEKVLWEIPADKLGRDLLWSTEIEQLPAGLGYGGTAVGDRVVRFTRRNNKVYLRSVSYAIRSEDEKGAIHRAVEAASLEPIIMAFDVEAEGEGKTAVIDVTKLLTTDVGEFSAKGALGGSGVDAGRTYIDKTKSFPTNIETKVLYTYTGGGGGFIFGAGRRVGGGGSISALIHYSLDLLPDKPMRGRYYDSRVGFFNEQYEEYGSSEHRVVERRYVARYRLEKKDPNAAVSEPVKPIVYYLSREVPEKWRPYMKRAVESWCEAFEKAGFINAIQCKDAPTVEQDPDWDPEDARYSVIRWAPTTFENAIGPHVHDPRSGEILSAHVIIWHNVMKLAETWYFTQVSPLDPRARKLPLPDDLMGQLLEYVVCHEVGHTLGLEHNFKASSSYTCKQLRDPVFTAKFGDEASIMDYGRFNYVAQPGDGARLIPRIGPYDKFAIEWGYKPLPEAASSEAEKPLLDRIAARQVTDPTVRFGNSRFDDPTQRMEDLGSDPIEATRFGLLNIARVAKLLVPATAKYGEDYSILREMYQATVGQRAREMGHVLSLVGGVVETDYHAGRGGDVFKPIASERQEAALQFLLANLFTTPRDLLLPDILNRIESSGAADAVLASQRGALAGLLGDDRIKRMMDNEALNGPKAFTVSKLVNELQAGLWSELGDPRPAIDLYRRNLQRAYLETMKARLVGDGATQTDLRPLGLGALRKLAKQIDATVPKAADPITAFHLQDCRRAIERILNPKG